jgi:hypothetical protein
MNKLGSSLIEKKVYFFKADIGVSASGELLPFDIFPIADHIAKLPWNNQGKYLSSPNQPITCCWVDSLMDPVQIRFSFIRKSEFPQIERQGDLTSLPIPNDSGIAEKIHVVFFPNNIVGSDFNLFGPRIGRLAEYLTVKAMPLCNKDLIFSPLLKQNVLAEMDKYGKIRLFQLRVRRSYIESLERADQSIHDAFEACALVGNAEEIEVVLKTKDHSRGFLNNSLFSSIKRILRLPRLHEEASKFCMKGLNKTTNRIDTVDLLNDKLIAKRQIMHLDNSRALDPDSAYQAIQSAYSELQNELIRAAEVFE